MTNTDPSHESSAPPTRRRYLHVLGAAGCVGLAGCEVLDSPVALPALTEGWAEIQPDNTVDLVLRFDEDIQSRIDQTPVSRDDLISKAKSEAESEGYSVSFEPVTVRGTEDVPDDETITGVIHDLVERESWPGGDRYTFKEGFAIADKAFEISIQGQSASVEFPVDNPLYHIRFPTGYEYILPELVDSPYKPPDVPQIFTYQGFSKQRTIPPIRHFDSVGVAKSRVFDAYRQHTFDNLRDVVDPNRHSDGSIELLHQGVVNLVWDIGEEGAKMIIPSGGFFPTAANDLQSIQEALNSEYAELAKGVNTFSGSAEAYGQNPWLHVTHPVMNDLYRHALHDYWYRNPAWVSASTREEARNRLKVYISSLESQADIIGNLMTETHFTGNYVSGDIYEDLYQGVRKVLPRIRTKLTHEISEWRTVKSAL